MVEISRLFWKRVLSSDNFVIGEIESAEVDPDTWQVTSFYVALTDQATELMGFKRPFLGKVTVCLPSTAIASIRDIALLNKPIKELQNLRECKQ
jgi:sporulation protein YlmC with PRC-barrel domain